MATTGSDGKTGVLWLPAKTNCGVNISAPGYMPAMVLLAFNRNKTSVEERTVALDARKDETPVIIRTVRDDDKTKQVEKAAVSIRFVTGENREETRTATTGSDGKTGVLWLPTKTNCKIKIDAPGYISNEVVQEFEYTKTAWISTHPLVKKEPRMPLFLVHVTPHIKDATVEIRDHPCVPAWYNGYCILSSDKVLYTLKTNALGNTRPFTVNPRGSYVAHIEKPGYIPVTLEFNTRVVDLFDDDDPSIETRPTLLTGDLKSALSDL